MAEVSSLEIKLKSNAKDIAHDFNTLKGSVSGTSKALSGIDGKSFNELASGVKKISSSKTDTKAFDDSLKSIAQSLNNFAQSINKIDTSKFDELSKKLDKIAEIGTKKINAATQSIRSLDKAASQNSGLKKAKMSYDEFMQSIKGLGSDRTFYGSLQQINTEIERTKNKIEKVNAQIEKYNAEGRSVETKGWRSAQAQLEQYSNYLDNLVSKQKELSSAETSKGIISPDFKFAPSFEDRLYQMGEEVQHWYSEIQAEIRNIGQPAIDAGYFEKLKQTVIQPNVDGEQILDQMDEIMLELHQKFETTPMKPQVQIDLDEFMRQAEEKSKQVAEEIKNRLTFTPTQLGKNQRYSDTYKDLEKQIEKAQKDLDKFIATQAKLDTIGVKNSSQRYKTAEYNIEQADKKLQSLYSDMKTLQSSGNDVVNISQFERLSDTAGKAQSTIQLLAKAFRGVGLGSAARSVQSISSELGSLSQGFAGVAETAEGAGSAMAGLQTAIPVIGLILAAVTILAKAFTSLAKKIVDFGKKTANAFISVLSKIKDVIAGILSIGTESGRSNTMIGRLVNKITDLVKSRLLRQGISKALDYAKEGFQKLDAYSESIGTKFHPNTLMILADLKLLGRSIAAAFEPIVNVAAPILDFLIKKIITVINYINQFFSALSGSSSWTRATLTAEDYTTAASGAAKAQKDLNKSIREWDKLNVITDPNKGNGGGGSASGSPTGTGYVTEDVASPIKDLAAKFKAAWEDGADFTEIGKDIGEKLKEGLEKINWDSIKETAGKVGKGLATLINGFVSVDGLDTEIGNAIGQAINTGITAFKEFTENINGALIGIFIGETVKTAINAIKWEDYITGMGNLGKQLAYAINDLANTDVLSEISKAVASLLKGAIEGAYQFVTTLDFENVGKKIGEAITSFFAKLNEVDEDGLTGFQKLGATVSGLITGIANTISNALDEVDWNEIGNSVLSFLGSIDWIELFKSGKNLKESIAKALTELFNLAVSSVGTIALSISIGIVEDVKEKLSEAKEWLKNNALEIGTKIFDFVQSIKEKWSEIKSWVANNAIDLVTKIPDIVEAVKAKIAEIKNWLTQNALQVSATLKDEVSSKIDSIKKKWNRLKFKAKNLTAKVKGGATEKIKKIKSAWAALKGGTKEFGINLKGKGLELLEKAKAIWDSFKEKAHKLSLSFSDSFSAPLKNMWNALANKINSALTGKVGTALGIDKYKLPTFATGGFPEDGWFRASQGEYLGKFDNGQSVIANNRQIENGLMNTVKAGNSEVAVLMAQNLAETRRQNQILTQILAKENNINYQDVFKATQKGAKEYKQRVGKPAFI